MIHCALYQDRLHSIKVIEDVISTQLVLSFACSSLLCLGFMCFRVGSTWIIENPDLTAEHTMNAYDGHGAVKE